MFILIERLIFVVPAFFVDSPNLNARSSPGSFLCQTLQAAQQNQGRWHERGNGCGSVG